MVEFPASLGRPRELRVDRAVRTAVAELLAEHGYAGTTIDRVAARAGVGKGALYRRWSTKAEMVFAAVVHAVELGAPPDTGSLEGDLGHIAAVVRLRLSDPTAAAAMAALALELRTVPELARSLDKRLFAEERRWVATILERADDRGDGPGTWVDPELVRQALVGPFVLATLYSPGSEPPAPEAVAALVTRGLRG